MNDLDLSVALHRDADLAGDPSPDLLDQLVRRRVQQRRRRAGALAVAAGVVLLGAGIPLGASFVNRSDGAPAVGITVAPTPSTPAEVPTTTAPVPDADPPCDFAAMDAALPADTAEETYTLHTGDGALCSGTWAAAGYTQVFIDPDGTEWPDGQAGIFHYVDGSWTWLDRYTTKVCDDPAIPAAVWERGCNVD